MEEETRRCLQRLERVGLQLRQIREFVASVADRQRAVLQREEGAQHLLQKLKTVQLRSLSSLIADENSHMKGRLDELFEAGQKIQAQISLQGRMLGLRSLKPAGDASLSLQTCAGETLEMMCEEDRFSLINKEGVGITLFLKPQTNETAAWMQIQSRLLNAKLSAKFKPS